MNYIALIFQKHWLHYQELQIFFHMNYSLKSLLFDITAFDQNLNTFLLYKLFIVYLVFV